MVTLVTLVRGPKGTSHGGPSPLLSESDLPPVGEGSLSTKEERNQVVNEWKAEITVDLKFAWTDFT